MSSLSAIPPKLLTNTIEVILGWIIFPFLNGATMGALGVLYRFGFNRQPATPAKVFK
ncbi:hypothetical protein BDV3_004216 [Batrachochytrium dendrobatidis]|nr:hypothetical protein O5D80_008131 [Batrachochytrium dendrobatidis]KAK5673092.1 hypothetical protein QVD99_000552 [Batrachochytrium dendrobatidis]